MPSTVNGIGTIYYGKSHLERYQAVCGHCGRAGMLESYETRLWFVILFIPIIPLGRKRVLDYCASCTRHRVLPLEEWERTRDRAIKEGLQKVTENPNDPKTAVEMHASLSFFGKKDEAAKMAAIMQEQFAADPDVLLYLGGWHERSGRGAEADACFEKALAAAPAHPAARRAVGLGCLGRGDLPRARQLLAFLEQPGEGQEPAVVFLLAKAYQRQREHEEALRLFRTALQGARALGRDPGFRKAVRESEKALGLKASMLPVAPRELLVRWGLPLAGLAALAIVWSINLHMAGNQTLQVVNGLKLPAAVALDGGKELVVGARARRALTCAEGRHRAVVRVAGLPDETVEIQATNGWFERFRDRTAFVLNVKGAAALLHETAVYTPVGQPGVAGSCSLLAGRSFVVVRDLDHIFEGFPPRISSERSSGQITRTRLGLELAEPGTVFLGLLGRVPEAEALRYAETNLDIDGSDPALVRSYAQVAMAVGQTERGRAFLEKGLDRRPLSVEWHRMYQVACEHTNKTEGLAARYDAMLAREPGNSALLYLRGRIAPRGAEALDFFERAIKADPGNAYPRFASAFQLASRGDLAGARPLAAEACRLMPGDPHMEDIFYQLRLGLGEHQALKAETLAKLAKAPLDLGLQLRLLEVCAAGGDLPGAADAHDAYAHQVLAKAGVVLPRGTRVGSPSVHAARVRAARSQLDAVGLVGASWLGLLYLQGDFGALLRESAALSTAGDKVRHGIQANLEMGKPAEAEKLLNAGKAGDGYLGLLMSLAWRRAGEEAKAAAWRQRGAQKLAAGGLSDKLAAELLAKGEALDLKAVEDLGIDVRQKVVLLVALAEGCPSKKNELLALAARLNYSMWFPHRFVEKAALDK